jgi:hypothetical protein
MASYGVAITLPLPVAGQVQWDGPLGDLLQALIDVLSQRVTVDGMDIGASLDMQGHALIDALNVQFISEGDSGAINTLYYSAGELFARDGSNRAVQITSGGVINVAGSGGFGGDYVSSNQNGASFTNSTSTFTFTAAGGTVYATMEGGEVKVHQGSSANSVGLKSPASLGSSFELTFPTSLPTNGGPALLRIDATGSIQCAASASFTESFDASAALPSAGLVGGYNTTVALAGWSIGGIGSTGSVDFPVPYQLGDRIDSLGVSLFGTSTVTASLMFRTDGAVGGGAGNQIARMAFAIANTTASLFYTMQNGSNTLTGTLPYTSPGTGSLYMNVNSGGNSQIVVGGSRFGRTRRLIS